MNDRTVRHHPARLPASLCGMAFVAALALPMLAQNSGDTDQYAQQDPAQQDPPDRVARLSFVNGNVSLEPSGVDQFSQAEANYPLTTGDRIYTDPASLAELESTGLAIRAGRSTDLTVTGLTGQAAQFGLAQGSIRVRSYALPNGSVVEIDTPNAAVTVLQPGDIRVDTDPQSDATIVTVTAGEVQVTGPGLNQLLESGQAIRLAGSDPVYAQAVGIMRPDNLDRFDQDRDAQRASAAQLIRDQYVNPDLIGYDDLATYGDWAPSPDYGAVWYPRAVAADWRPYSNGHWAWVAPWGWTWVAAEPWGFAPFHYGRWAQFPNPYGAPRWGWVPGPPVVRPVYSPALVAFVGGPNFSISVGFGGGPGAGVTAWFPLGPREPYIPWYHASPGYVNRVNVSNIYNRNAVEVRNVYNNRTTNVYVNNTTVNNVYVNRSIATTAVPQKSFAAGRPVSGAQVRVDPRQLDNAQVLPHPLITPTREIVTAAPARAVPVNTARPSLASRARGQQPPPNQPAAFDRFNRPAAAQTNPAQPQPAQQPGPRTPAALYPAQVTPQPAPVNQRASTPAPQPSSPQPVAPIQRQPANAPNSMLRQPQPNPEIARPQAPAAPVPAPQPRPADQPRPLVNRVEPPQPQPKFEVQQREIERNDPGRPLGPQQTQNVREGRPAGPPQQTEPVNHPQPQGRPQPQTQRAQPPPPARPTPQ